MRSSLLLYRGFISVGIYFLVNGGNRWGWMRIDPKKAIFERVYRHRGNLGFPLSYDSTTMDQRIMNIKTENNKKWGCTWGVVFTFLGFDTPYVRNGTEGQKKGAQEMDLGTLFNWKASGAFFLEQPYIPSMKCAIKPEQGGHLWASQWGSLGGGGVHLMGRNALTLEWEHYNSKNFVITTIALKLTLLPGTRRTKWYLL